MNALLDGVRWLWLVGGGAACVALLVLLARVLLFDNNKSARHTDIALGTKRKSVGKKPL